MNLIDKEELLNERPEMLNPNMNDGIKSAYNKGWNACNSEWIGLIEGLTTAYDIDKVVERLSNSDVGTMFCSKCKYAEECETIADEMLEKHKLSDYVDLCAMVMKTKAIEIVKKGGEV